VQDYVVADINCVTAEITRIRGVHNNAFVRRYSAFDRDTRIEVKGRRVIHQEAIGQWTKAGIDVIEAFVG